MGRSRRNREIDRYEAGAKFVLMLIVLAALGLGGIQNFTQTFIGLLTLLIILCVMGAAAFGIITLIRKTDWSPLFKKSSLTDQPNLRAPLKPKAQVQCVHVAATSNSVKWDDQSVYRQMQKIDWYQFEKLCAAILEAEGFSVKRKGGAQPDGGVDLIACKFDGNETLIQCKHWNSWKVGEPVVRQMLGSMADFGVRLGAIYTMKGWTQPAQEFANKHHIQLVSGEELARRAHQTIAPKQLNIILDDSVHHCPKCEAPMILRTGDFKPFWGCSRFPKCRGKIKITNHYA